MSRGRPIFALKRGVSLSAGFCAAIFLFAALPARAGTFYVTVAGLGGEPDYDQRFTAMANDLDKLFKASGSDVHVVTLTGGDATRAKLTEALGNVAREAKPADDFVQLLLYRARLLRITLSTNTIWWALI